MKNLKKRTILLFTLMLILLSLTVQGASAMREDVPQMNTDDMKERTIEMIVNNIESLETLQSETDDDEHNDSIDDLLGQLETLKSELESAEDDEDVHEIMSKLRTLIEESPEEIKEKLMENGMMGGPEHGEFPQDNNTLRGPGGKRGNGEEVAPGMDGLMGNESMRDTDFNQENAGEKKPQDKEPENEDNGLLSSFINKIMSLLR